MELIKCPNCGATTIEKTTVDKVEKPEEMPFEEYVNREKKYYESLGEVGIQQSSGDIYLSGFYTQKKPLQLVFKCKTCGYTKVVEF